MGITYKDIIEMDGKKLVLALAEEYYRPIPTGISTPEEMAEAGSRLAEITNQYSYVMMLLAMAKSQTRLLRRGDEEYNVMMGKRDTLEAVVKMLSQMYAGLSREISTRTAALKEINMSSAL